MFNPFVCGSGNFHQEEEDDPWGPSLTPRRSISSRRSKSNSKNPYSNRGLDKFANVLSDLEQRRQKIYERIGSQDVPLVRFVYSNSKGWVPIVVKLRDSKQDKTAKLGKDKPITRNSDKSGTELSVVATVIKEVERQRPGSDGTMTKKMSFLSSVNLVRWRRRPSSYWPMVIVLILLCLVIYGRSFAILCTSIWWYLVPTMKGGGLNLKRSMKKKEYVKALSGKKLDSDASSSPKRKKLRLGSSPWQHGN